MKKIVILGYLFLIIFSQTFADESTNIFENIFFTWQLYSYLDEVNQNTNVFESLDQSINANFNRLMNFNLTQRAAAGLAGFSLFVGSVIDYSFNWRQRRISNQERRIQNELWGDPWAQQMERLREMEIIERGFYRDSSRILY